MNVCQDGRNNQIALLRPSSVTFHVQLAVEPCRTNVLLVMMDSSLLTTSVSLVTRHVRHVQSALELTSVIHAGKANGHLHQALVSAVVYPAENATALLAVAVMHVMTTLLLLTDSVDATTDSVNHSNTIVYLHAHSDILETLMANVHSPLDLPEFMLTVDLAEQVAMD